MNRIKNIVVILTLLISFSASGSGWIKKANYGGDARHRTTAFTLGNKGYLGLGHVNSSGVNFLFKDFWAYDPGSNSWTQIADYGGSYMYHCASFVIDNKAYVGNGRDQWSNYVDDFFVYDPLTNTWAQVADFPGAVRRGAVGFAVDGIGYVGTGQTYSGVSGDFWKYDPTIDQWSSAPSLPGPARTSAVAFDLNGKGYVGTGGASTWGNSLNDFWEFDPATNQWSQKANVGPTTRMEACGFAVMGKGFIGTGDNVSSGTNYGDFWEYDPGTDTWTQIDEFAGLKRRYLVAFVIGDRAFAGTGTNGTNFRDFWEFDYLLSVVNRDNDLVKVNTYPNPIINNLNIEINNLPKGMSYSKLSCVIYNTSGQIVIERSFDDQRLNLSVDHLSKGLYIYHIVYRDQSIRTGKLIKQ